MTSFPDARALVLAAVAPLGTERAKLAGRVMAGELVAPFDVPAFDNSQVDGYAVRSTDSGSRRIVGESAAGGPRSPIVQQGEAVRIFTGAPLPEGADAVVMQEDAQIVAGQLETDERVSKGAFIRRKGEEITEGTAFDVRGQIATPPLVGLAASFGVTEAEVYRRPRIAIVATGSELVRPGERLERGQTYASNLEALQAALQGIGLEAETFLVHDEPSATQSVLSNALETADLLITVGGVSVGDHDFVRPALASLGVEEHLWRVAMKPGKPFYFGQRGHKPVFGLPGNPVSALVTFALLVRPALRRLIGLPDAEEETTARLGTKIERTDLRYEFVRATLVNGVATPVEAQGSHMQTGLAFANALIHLPEGIALFEQDGEVVVTPLTWGLM